MASGRSNAVAKALDAGGLAATRVVSQALQFLLFLLAARLLTVAEFGIFSLVLAVTLGFTVLAEAGWREVALCSEQPDIGPRLNFLALIAGGLMALALLGSSAISLAVGLNRDFALIGSILAVWVALRPLSTVQVGILVHRGKMRQIVAMQIFSEAAGFLAGAAALWAGMGVVSLAIGKAALMTFEFGIGAYCVGSIKFRVPDRPSRYGILAFSKPILAARLLQFLQVNYSTLAIGVIFSPAVVGIYRAAVRIAGMAQETVREPARYLGWSGLLAARNSRQPGFDPFPEAATRFFEAVCTIGIPAFILLAAVSRPLVELLLGPTWVEVAPLLAILAIAAAARLLTVAVEPVLSLQGHPELVQRNAMTVFAVNLLCFALALPFGIKGIAVAELVAAVAVLPLVFRVLQSSGGGVQFTAFVRALAPTAVGCLVCALAVWAFRTKLPVAEWQPVRQIAATAALVGTLQFTVVATFHLTRRWFTTSREVTA